MIAKDQTIPLIPQPDLGLKNSLHTPTM